MNTIQKILYLLKKNNLTASKLAESLKVSDSLVTSWKNGTCESYTNYIDKIALILNVKPEYLTNEDDTNITDYTNITPTQRLFNLINEKNIKQKTLANKINVPVSTLNQWFKFDREIPQKYIIPICEFLKIDMEWLLTGNIKDKTNNTDFKNTYIDNKQNTLNKTDENILLEIYRNLTESEKHEFMEFAYRMKFYHDENLSKEKIQSKLEALNSIDNTDSSKTKINKII